MYKKQSNIILQKGHHMLVFPMSLDNPYELLCFGFFMMFFTIFMMF